jgi:hypothetical protein
MSDPILLVLFALVVVFVARLVSSRRPASSGMHWPWG